MELKGKTALITGGAKRVGRVIAQKLAEKGVSVVLHYHRSQKEALKAQEEIRTLGVSCALVCGDLSKSPEIRRITQELSEKGLRIDLLINSASVFYKTPLSQTRESDWDALMDTNLKGPFLLSQDLGLKMASGTGGKILNIADWSGFRPYGDYLPYCVSKGGLLTLTKALARDLAPKVLVNAIAPGPVLQPADLSEEEKKSVSQKTLLGRWGTPEDIASAAVFLFENDFVNGTVLVVDGGRSIV